MNIHRLHLVFEKHRCDRLLTLFETDHATEMAELYNCYAFLLESLAEDFYAGVTGAVELSLET